VLNLGSQPVFAGVFRREFREEFEETRVSENGTDADFLHRASVGGGMKSTRKGLRKGDLEKDNYQRLRCADCETELKTENDPDEVYNVRRCPDCGSEWKELR
jgi:DNA-directed RNA polymerase subunit RPC12/RpoP